MGRIVCKDGFSMSVQVGCYLYCTPKLDVGPWQEVEVGFPNKIETELMPYAESPNEPKDTVYPYVPAELVDSLIQKHGGFDKIETV